MAMFTRGSRKRRLARIALIGPSGSGKTLSALKMATVLVREMAPGKRIRFIDTENHSSELYAGDRDPDVGLLDFDVCPLPNPEAGLHDFHPENYQRAIRAANEDGQTGVLIVDSASHAWTGVGGVLDQKDKASAQRGVNDYTAWRYASPLHAKFVDTMIFAPFHLIVCMRAKTEYAMQDDPKTGKKQVVKLGMAAEQRAGLEYEFDVVGDMTMQHQLVVSKSRCRAVDGRTFDAPGLEPARTLAAWFSQGVEEIEAAPPAAVGAVSGGSAGTDAPKNGAARPPPATQETPSSAISTAITTQSPEVQAVAKRLMEFDSDDLEALNEIGAEIARLKATIEPSVLAFMREQFNAIDRDIRMKGRGH